MGTEARALGDVVPKSRGSAAPRPAVGGVRPFRANIATRQAELRTQGRASAPSTDGKGFLPVLNIYALFVYIMILFITVLCLLLICTRFNLVHKIKLEDTRPAIRTVVRVLTRPLRGLVSGAP